MQEFFFTILSIWFIWKIYDVFASPRRSGNSYSQTHHHHYYEKRQEQNGQVRVETKKKKSGRIPSDEGEYVDYEEIK